ncbi:pyrroloquinoline quinone biosynthesis peptide chaperone PqqD [Notoacmeibacter sp. MSK16QG-6]|uniref:pyrroloquinoline quinone biosynthesis peptide chaperone PqqD n=1 Tax=Notoacmeibacter sp. MSK16QG-6 TaxID=2957982 RepID=UPI00209DE008|nr:pyrroloquinoline quinone biosynthesis peptide chaperone PqqD [Notoacmeibacter sp. MSK16QG-6]MCP1200670.1 pyrroloquinoline quinone biosynthesis peptide chaperone PqqD [Notoacmeibacter sp. MSK16QG-6]
MNDRPDIGVEPLAQTITGHTVPALPRGVRVHDDKVRARTVLLAPERTLALDETSIAILNVTDGARSVRQISEALAEAYAAPVDVIEADVIGFFEALRDKRMVELT